MEKYLNKQIQTTVPLSGLIQDACPLTGGTVRGDALTEFWKDTEDAKSQQAECPVHARCKEECNTDSYKSDGTPFAEAMAIFQCIKTCKDCATKLQNLAQYIPHAGHELYEDFRAAEDVQSLDDIKNNPAKAVKFDRDLKLLRYCYKEVGALHGACGPTNLYDVSDEARMMFGAELYSDAFRRVCRAHQRITCA